MEELPTLPPMEQRGTKKGFGYWVFAQEACLVVAGRAEAGMEVGMYVEVRARFLKACKGSYGVREEGTVGDMPAGWVVEAVD